VSAIIIRRNDDRLIHACARQASINGNSGDLRNWPWLNSTALRIDVAQAVENACRRCALAREKIEEIYRATPNSLVPVATMMDAIHDLASRNTALYVLSNMQRHSWAHLSTAYDFWRCFRGIVVSYKINLLKPDTEIFAYISDRYALDPAKTIFLDDSIDNINAARAFGMKALHVAEPGLAAQILYRAVEP
jgi:HAD superfamily hydrolase (TIGR01509 family)